MGGLRVAVLFVAVFYKTCNGDGADDPLVVQTSYGPVRGHSFVSSWTKQTVYAFQGIPYAAPPVGNLRFKDPVLPEKWTSIKDCTKDKDSCMQEGTSLLRKLNITFSVSEDCLYLNVYSPKLKPERPLPVLVWVHGGAFLGGSGSHARYGADFLVAEGIIVVTINYRLGAFGFLTLGTSEVPGNAGLKDQRLALQWIQREIGQFGGDAGNVTIFGESAGSACVHLHSLSPLSKGLFHRAIGNSGASLGWAIRENGKAYGLRLASVLNCSTEDLSVTQQCLRTVPAEDILRSQGLVKYTDGDAMEVLNLVFIPTVDKFSSKEPFIPDHPRNLIKQKSGSHVPFLMGITGQEGLIVLSMSDEAKVNNITNNLYKFLTWQKRNSSTSPEIQIITEKIKNLYFKEADTLPKRVKGFVSLYTDYLIGYHTAFCAREFNLRGTVYLYNFQFNGEFKEPNYIDLHKKYNVPGVAHAEDLNYLFIRCEVNQTSAENSREMLTWKRMARMWANFAKFGTPTVGADPLLQNVNWAPITQNSTKYLRIDDNLTMEAEDFLASSVKVWDNITPVFG